MTLKEIFSQSTPSDVIDALKKGRNAPLPDVEAARKAIDPEKHDVNDRTKRPDKRVAVSDSEESSGLQVTSDVPGGSKGTTRPEPVARISLAIQQLIIKRAVSFLFGNDPAYNADTESEQQQAVMRAFGRILREVKCNSVNRRVGGLRAPANLAGYPCVGANCIRPHETPPVGPNKYVRHPSLSGRLWGVCCCAPTRIP